MSDGNDAGTGIWTPWRALLPWAAAAAYVGIAAASLVPKPYRPSTGLIPGALEHMGAYFVLGVIAALAVRERFPLKRLALANTFYAGALEAAQMALPGRVASFIDFLASAGGSTLAIAAVAALLVRRRGG